MRRGDDAGGGGGRSGVMVTLDGDGGTGLAALEKVAFVERLMPAEWRRRLE